MDALSLVELLTNLDVVEQVDGSVRPLQQRHPQGRGLDRGQQDGAGSHPQHVVEASDGGEVSCRHRAQPVGWRATLSQSGDAEGGRPTEHGRAEQRGQQLLQDGVVLRLQRQRNERVHSSVSRDLDSRGQTLRDETSAHHLISSTLSRRSMFHHVLPSLSCFSPSSQQTVDIKYSFLEI